MDNVGPIGNLSELVGDIEDPFAKRAPSTTLGKEAFLLLLTPQFQHQTQHETMDNQQFVAQMAEFSALEQMQHLNNWKVISAVKSES